MDERRKGNNKPRWKIKIKELKKDIELFQCELDNLLKKVSSNTNQDDNILCVLCDKNIAKHKLPCQHDVCFSCQQNHIKNKSIITCPTCQEKHYHSRVNSFSSSSDEMI